MSGKEGKKASCPECGEYRMVRKDGTLAIHRPPEALVTQPRGARQHGPRACPGSNKRPVK